MMNFPKDFWEKQNASGDEEGRPTYQYRIDSYSVAGIVSLVGAFTHQPVFLLSVLLPVIEGFFEAWRNIGFPKPLSKLMKKQNQKKGSKDEPTVHDL